MAKIPENPTPGRPWGRALRRTPDEIARLSLITDADIINAQKLFDDNAPDDLKGLLGARLKDEENPPTL
jgi:hypothetical protein